MIYSLYHSAVETFIRSKYERKLYISKSPNHTVKESKPLQKETRPQPQTKAPTSNPTQLKAIERHPPARTQPKTKKPDQVNCITISVP